MTQLRKRASLIKEFSKETVPRFGGVLMPGDFRIIYGKEYEFIIIVPSFVKGG